MDSDQQLKQLLSPDLSSLGTYYRDMSTFQGAGVLVVNYYPSGEVAQMSAKGVVKMTKFTRNVPPTKRIQSFFTPEVTTFQTEVKSSDF